MACRKPNERWEVENYFRQLCEDGRGVFWYVDAICQNETERINSLFYIYGALLFVFTIGLFGWGIGAMATDWKAAVWLILWVALILMTLELLMERGTVRQKKAMCPRYIVVKKDSIIVNEMHLTKEDIEKLVITDGNLHSSSLLPVQRYLKIYTGGKKYKYWLGSEYSLDEKTYQLLADLLLHFFDREPNKLKFVSRRKP